MFIASCSVKNYKSFRDSERISFSRGFNVIVGKNNAGKTALMEALSLQFENMPHRSEKEPSQNRSMVTVEFGMDADEAGGFLSKRGPFAIPNDIVDGVHGMQRFSDSVKHGPRISFDRVDKTILKAHWVGASAGSGSVQVVWDPVRKMVVHSGPGSATQQFNLSLDIAQTEFIPSIYIFRAQRMNLGEYSQGTNEVLKPNAENLPAVLNLLQTNNPRRYDRLQESIRTVFPDIHEISTVPVDSSRVQIRVWFVDPANERPELAIPLADCGTGVGQVLAMLYVVINSGNPRTLLIDEPQSFLHPGAIQKLFEIFKRTEHRKHQFIVTTHAPNVVTAASPCSIVLLRREFGESKIETIDANETSELRLLLNEIGARLSDVFGADRILWVEGKTEEVCFRKIVTEKLDMELRGTEILGLINVGDLEGQKKEVIFEIYKKLSTGRALLPPTLCICLDREGRTETKRQELTANSNGKIQFIPRRMFENYLLNPKAIAAVLAEADTENGNKASEQDVSAWLEKRQRAEDASKWVVDVDAANLLRELFNALSETRVDYNKLRHGEMLTDWIIRNSSKDFNELADFLGRNLEVPA